MTEYELRLIEEQINQSGMYCTYCGEECRELILTTPESIVICETCNYLTD